MATLFAGSSVTVQRGTTEDRSIAEEHGTTPPWLARPIAVS